MTALRVLLADDHTLVRAGLLKLLESLPGVTVVALAGDGNQAVELTQAHQPDIVLLDVAMPRCGGLDAARTILERWPRIRVVFLSMYDNEEYLRHALAVGASGYLLKDAAPEELELALETVTQGRLYLGSQLTARLTQALAAPVQAPQPVHHLSPRQTEVLRLIAQGHSTKTIARELDVSVKTVETHRQRLMQELDVHEVTGLVRYALRAGLVELE